MITAIIQARFGSKRLPGKVLKKVQGRTLLEWHIRRVKEAKKLDRIILATSNKKQDEPLAKIAKKLGVQVFRGNENDVLDRFYKAAEKFSSGDDIIRLMADCPLIDPKIIDETIDYYLKRKKEIDYTSKPLNYPQGFDVEIFSFATLARAWREARKLSEREHVTPYIKQHPEIFRVHYWKKGKENNSKIHLSVDESRDLMLIKKIFGYFKDKEMFYKDDILNLFKKSPKLKEINKGLTGYEGYLKSLKKEGTKHINEHDPVVKKIMQSSNNTIWLFAGGPMQVIAAKKIKERGFKLIITDMDPKCACRKYADEFVALNTFDLDGNLKAASKLSKKYDIKAVLTEGADCHETVAFVVRALGLHGIDPKISNACRNKLETRIILTKAGILQPLFAKVGNMEEAKQALKNIGLPAVLKASDNSGSRGFSKIEKISDFNESVLEKAIKFGTTGYAVLEQLLKPIKNEIAEQSVETLWYDGRMYWLNWVDRLFRKDIALFENFNRKKKIPVGWGVELAHINPALHDYEIKKRVEDMIYQAGVALGMREQKGGHVLKADIMLTENGPYILEMTPRLSGGWDCSKTTPLRGGDFIGGIINLALGEELTLDFWHKYFEYKDPNLFAAVFAEVRKDSQDNIGRKFAAGGDYDREKSLLKAYKNLKSGNYI